MTRISEAVECLEELGYTVTPPKVEVPTEPGWYLGTDELNGNPSFPMLIATDGSTHYPDATRAGGFSVLGDPERFAPFTKLEPVPVTAKKVLDAVMSDMVLTGIAADAYQHLEARIKHVAQQFGVTD